MTDQQQFTTELDARIIAAIREGCDGLPSLLPRLAGASPHDAIRALRRLGFDGPSARPAEATFPLVSTPRHLSHPLDFDWRFTAPTQRALASSIADRKGAAGLIGTPSLLPLLAGDHREVWLLDRCPPALIGGKVHVEQFDALTDEPPRISVEFILADPPWYPEHITAFTRVAASLLQLGGECWLTLPGVGTRPGIQDERVHLERLANGCGLERISVSEAYVNYETPFFEFNALRAAGIDAPLPRWRFGDILHFRRAGNAVPLPQERPSDSSWREIITGATRWRLRSSPTIDVTRPILTPLVDSHVVPSVSRRYPGRDLAAVWTSGNRAYFSQGIPLLEAALCAILTESPPWIIGAERLKRPLSSAERYRLDEAHDICRKVLEEELQEQRDYERWMACGTPRES